MAGQFFQAFFFQPDIVIIIHIIDADYLNICNFLKKTLGEIGTDKAGNARDKHSFACQNYI